MKFNNHETHQPHEISEYEYEYEYEYEKPSSFRVFSAFRGSKTKQASP